ncbi:MAG: DUF3310 domain-containing protein [Clostridia bacterium]|nr:DUF3310 domain-containing protein [Clostridia bacterium]
MIHDPVNHPSHYCDGGIETIDFIEAKQLPYHLGNAVKYISRAGKKDDELQDLRKARWYLDRYIQLREHEILDYKKEQPENYLLNEGGQK